MARLFENVSTPCVNSSKQYLEKVVNHIYSNDFNPRHIAICKHVNKFFVQKVVVREVNPEHRGFCAVILCTSYFIISLMFLPLDVLHLLKEPSLPWATLKQSTPSLKKSGKGECFKLIDAYIYKLACLVRTKTLVLPERFTDFWFNCILAEIQF